MAELPRGTLSLLFTDIEGSTQLQHRLGERYREVVNEHRRLLEATIESHGGQVVDRQTESFFVVFPRMRDAAAAAADAQRALAAQEWPDGAQVKVRMGLHAGEPELEGDRYVGLAVARAARIAATAHGGQVLLSGAARGLLPERSRVRPLGSYPLKDFGSPEPLFQLEIDGLPARFPRPRVAPKRSRRRLLLIAGAALVLAAGAAVAAMLALGGSDGGGLSLVRPNNVAVIDPRTNEIVAEVPVGIRPGPITFGAGSVWVGNTEDRTLTRIDPKTRTSAGTIGLDGQTPTGLAFGEGALWVAHGFLGRVSRVDPQFGRLTDTLNLVRGTIGGGAVAVGGGSVWAVFRESTIIRIDPRAVRAAGEGIAGTSPSALVYVNGRLDRQQPRPHGVPLQRRHVRGRRRRNRERGGGAGGDRVRCRRTLGRERGRRHRHQGRSEHALDVHDRSRRSGRIGVVATSDAIWVAGQERDDLANRPEPAPGREDDQGRQRPGRNRCRGRPCLGCRAGLVTRNATTSGRPPSDRAAAAG